MDWQHIARTLKEQINKSQIEICESGYRFYLRELKQSLRRKFSGADIDELLRGRSEYNSRGRFYIIEEELSPQLMRLDSHLITNRLRTILSFLQGIREKTARVLNRKGYTTIDDLLSHPRFGSRAQQVWRILEEGDTQELLSLCCMRYPKSSPIFLFLSQLFEPQEFVFLDIESLGLFSGNMLFLVGMIKFGSQGAKLIQILARFPEEEPALLLETARLLKDVKVMVSFNGKTFDSPYLEHRGAMYNIEFKKPLLHLDLLHFSRRILRQLSDGFKLTNIEEKILNRNREQDISSEYVPLLYREYLKEREPGYLYPIIGHNKNDLMSLVELLNFLYSKCL